MLQILQFLSLAEISGGDRLNGIRAVRKAIEIDDQFSSKVRNGARLARALARVGHLQEAQEALAAAEFQLDRFRKAKGKSQRKNWAKWKNRVQGRIAWVKGEIYFFRGQYTKAETQYRKAVNHYRRIAFLIIKEINIYAIKF